MTNNKISITDAATGETIERLMTDEEQSAHNSYIAKIKTEAEAKANAEAQAADDKAAAQAKLQALGLTANDLKALGL